MLALVIRPKSYTDPLQSMQMEIVEVPATLRDYMAILINATEKSML